MPSRKGHANRDMDVIEGHTLDERGTRGARTIDDAGLQDYLKRSTRFAYSQYVHASGARMTCRAERRGKTGTFWYGYIRDGHGKLHNAYIGKAENITFDRLFQVARALNLKGTETPDYTFKGMDEFKRVIGRFQADFMARWGRLPVFGEHPTLARDGYEYTLYWREPKTVDSDGDWLAPSTSSKWWFTAKRGALWLADYLAKGQPDYEMLKPK